MTKAIILAAGTGSRLRPYTDNNPKGMVEVCKKPILQYQFETLKALGIQDIVVVCGYMKDKIKSSSVDISKIENHRWSETNMVSSLYCAKEWLDEDVIISYSDIIYEREILANILNNEADIVVSADKEFLRYWKLRIENPLDDVESFNTNSKGCIIELGQKSDSLDSIEAQYIGLMRFQNSGIDALKTVLNNYKNSPKFDSMYMTELLMHLIQSGYCLTPNYHENGWLEIDSVDDLILAEKALNGELKIELINSLKI